jgi:FAD/FMN-containing dehydrogenase
MEIFKNHTFKNWAKIVTVRPPVFAQPETEADIIGLIKSHKKVRIYGSGHSWSDHFSTDELLLNLDRYNKVLNLDKSNKTIKVQAGIKLWQLNELLDQNGLALINLGSIDKQSVSGAINTGTHGTGINFQCLASQVLEFSLITASGEKKIFRKGEQLFNAAIISLGTLGIISEITLELTDAFNLHDRTFTYNFQDFIEHIDEFVNSYDHFKIWWMVPSEKVVVYTYRRTNEKANDSALRRFLNDQVFPVIGYGTLVKIGNLYHPWRIPINKLLTENFDKPLDRIEKSYKVFVVAKPPNHREAEWAFDYKNAKKLLSGYRELFLTMKDSFSFIQEVRFTKGDDFWLSPCYRRDTIWLSAYNHHTTEWKSIMTNFENFTQQHGGRPHWGKEFSVDKEYVSKFYPKYHEFIGLKKEFDPTDKFSNKFTQSIF